VSNKKAGYGDPETLPDEFMKHRRVLLSVVRGLRRRTNGASPVATQIVTMPASTRNSAFSYMYRILVKDKPAFGGFIIILAFLGWSIFEGALQIVDSVSNTNYATMVLGGNPLLLDFSHSLVPPSTSSFGLLFGTDYYGHSILLSILYAAPRDAGAGVLVVVSGIVIGMLLGTSAAYLGGWAEIVFMRLTDAFLSVPALVLAIAVSIMVGTGFASVLIALTVVWWPTYARFFRGQALSLKGRSFVAAARLCGTGFLRVMFRHIIPNSLDPIIAYAALDFGNVVLWYSSLAFIGIGVQPPIPEWGEMASAGLEYLPATWWWSFFPCVVILAIVISFTLVGDRLQDVISGRPIT